MADIDEFSDDDDISVSNDKKIFDDDDDDDDDDEYDEDRYIPSMKNKEVEEDKEGSEEEEEEEDYVSVSDSDEGEQEEEDQVFRKISHQMKQNILQEYHTELQFRSMDEIQQMANVVRNIRGEIIDPLHRTIPILSKYEKARILGERARQIEEGAQTFIQVPPEIIDSYVIAEMELKEKAIPFIIERPLPHGGCEFWRLCDLEFI